MTGVKASSPPRLVLEDDKPTGIFKGKIEAYVDQPDGQMVKVASFSAVSLKFAEVI